MTEANYDKPELRERIKNRIKASSRGAAPGQWSAIKSNILAKEYKEAGGGYKSGKTKAQKALQKWNKDDWQYSDGSKSGNKGRYRPAAIWSKLTKKEKDSLNQSKYRGNKQGKQSVPIPKKLKDKVQPSEFSWDGLIIEFAKVEKDVKVKSYRTKSGSRVNPFRRRQKVNKEESETTVKPNNLKALGIQAGIMTAALAVPLIPIGVQAARGKMSDIRIKRYQKAATKALPAPTLGKGAFGAVQDISESQVGKVLQPYEPIANTPRPIREIVTGRDKEFEILKQLESTGVTPKPGKKNRFGFTMEKIEGEPLASFLKNTLQDPSEEQLQSIGQKLGEAVSKVHGAGVLHADLHTNNVFVSNKGEIKIIDFGEAVRINKLKDKSKLTEYKEQDLEKVASNVGSFLNRDAFTRDERKAAERKLAVFRESLFLGYGKND